MNTAKRRAYMREYMRLRRAVNKAVNTVNTLSPAPAQTVCPPEAPARVVCSACKHLAATYHHCLVKKDIRIANSDRAIECGEYVPAGRRAHRTGA
jgi:hypothetical protein